MCVREDVWLVFAISKVTRTESLKFVNCGDQ